MKKQIELSGLLKILDKNLENLPDKRKKSNNQKYSVKDAVNAAFSVFFTQCPSFLEHQKMMRTNKGKDNGQSLFKIEKIPCDNQIRKLLDPIPASTIFGTFYQGYKLLKSSGIIKQYKYLGEELLIGLDGTEYFSSKKINCPHCNCRKHRNGTVTYFHGVVLPTIVSPLQNKVINLEPEFIKKQDGYNKQDCENAAVKRWLKNNLAQKYSENVTLLGDDLYSHESIINLAKKQGYNFIFVAKNTSHFNLYDWLEFLEKSGEVKTLEKKLWDGKKNLTYYYRYLNNVPLTDSDNSILVNWCEVKVIESKTSKIIYQNSWITNHIINDDNVVNIVKAGRSRWKLENEGNNVLKNHGYNLEHNFGHGEEHLCEFLLCLNLLSFLFHTILDLVNSLYQQVRNFLKTRRTFFNDLRALLRYHYFESWDSLFIFILTEGDSRDLFNSC